MLLFSFLMACGIANIRSFRAMGRGMPQDESDRQNGQLRGSGPVHEQRDLSRHIIHGNILVVLMFVWITHSQCLYMRNHLLIGLVSMRLLRVLQCQRVLRVCTAIKLTNSVLHVVTTILVITTRGINTTGRPTCAPTTPARTKGFASVCSRTKTISSAASVSQVIFQQRPSSFDIL